MPEAEIRTRGGHGNRFEESYFHSWVGVQAGQEFLSHGWTPDSRLTGFRLPQGIAVDRGFTGTRPRSRYHRAFAEGTMSAHRILLILVLILSSALAPWLAR